MANKKEKQTLVKLSGKLRTCIMWPVWISIIQVMMAAGVYFTDKTWGIAMALVTVVSITVYIIITWVLRKGIMKEMIEFSSNYSQVQRMLLHELNVPYGLIEKNGKILWMNKAMQEIIGKDCKYGITTIMPQISVNDLPRNEEEKQLHITYCQRSYRIEFKQIDAKDLMENVSVIENYEDNTFLTMYMFDETDINMYIQKLKDERFVSALVYIDNYEEVLESVDDVRRSLFVGLIDKKVNKYFSNGEAIIRKLEKDKYLVVFKYKFLEKLIADKFSILEDIKSVKINNEMNITLSVAVGTGGNDYAKNYDIARSAMDLALGRGGDQAVVKDSDTVTYFGGKSQKMEKNTRVKVRVKAHALRQILESTSTVLIMGHKLADIDAFGSAIGIYAICRRLGKKAYIVIDDITTSVRPFKERFERDDDYPDDLFLSSREAPDFVDSQTAVIVVDVNKPYMTECPELLDKCEVKMVFDHHRQTDDSIAGVVLSYIDPYASSAAEMITEMIQYVDENVKIKPYEADALYAGINIDTDGFHSKSGPRTFEAAAFLRRHGADVTRVRKMLRNDMTEYKAIAKAVSEAEVYRGAFAIAVFNGEGVESPTIGGAKAANQLLDISGIKASFVVTAYNARIYVSARSIDEVNVQRVMEKLGGGGHISIAGAQFTECTTEQVIHKIKLTLDNMLEEGEI